MNIVIDMQGKLCPMPVIETRKELKLNPQHPVVTIVDNWIAVENLQKLGKQMGYDIVVEEKSKKEYHVLLKVSEVVAKIVLETEKVSENKGETVVVISSDVMGQGDDVLGKALLKGYIYAMTQLDTPPDCILFYNGGVHLSVTGADTLEDLLFLEKNGTKIASCGACLGHYKLSEQLAVGEVTNMYTIAEILSTAGRIIKP